LNPIALQRFLIEIEYTRVATAAAAVIDPWPDWSGRSRVVGGRALRHGKE
jgi:hypothetical protein